MTAETRTAFLAPKVREIPFEFPDDLDPVWMRSEPEWVAMVNSASLAMPYLEPFLIRTVREAKGQLSNPMLRLDANAFIGQEGQHYQAHRRFNELLKQKRYPALEQIEKQMDRHYRQLDTRSLRSRLAYTAGFETITMGLTRWIVEDRVRLFKDADPRVASFILWHMVEETEHQCVAFDIYEDCFGAGRGASIDRALGVLHSAFDLVRFSIKGYRSILQRDRRWHRPKSRLRLARWILRFWVNVGPTLFRSAFPSHNPRHFNAPTWVTSWLRHYSSESRQVPLVDTSHPQMPVPFAKAQENLAS